MSSAMSYCPACQLLGLCVSRRHGFGEGDAQATRRACLQAREAQGMRPKLPRAGPRRPRYYPVAGFSPHAMAQDLRGLPITQGVLLQWVEQLLRVAHAHMVAQELQARRARRRWMGLVHSLARRDLTLWYHWRRRHLRDRAKNPSSREDALAAPWHQWIPPTQWESVASLTREGPLSATPGWRPPRLIRSRRGWRVAPPKRRPSGGRGAEEAPPSSKS
jgi:hypothetical protein